MNKILPPFFEILKKKRQIARNINSLFENRKTCSSMIMIFIIDDKLNFRSNLANTWVEVSLCFFKSIIVISGLHVKSHFL